MVLKRIIVLIICWSGVINIYADAGIAPYIVDGKLAIYFPSIKNIAPTWKIIIQKTSGAEANSIISKIQKQIRLKMSKNILDAKEAASIGLDPNGGVAYVHLKKNLGYIVFTVKNERLLRYTLDNLVNPIPYRIENKYIIFSGSDEIMEYYQFKGLKSTEEFQKAAEVLKFNWKQNFFWMDSDYFLTQNLLPCDGAMVPQGDKLAGIFQVNQAGITLNLYTLYGDPEVNEMIKKIIKIKKVQKLSFLDYEVDIPAIVGQMYLSLPDFINSLKLIDKMDIIQFNKLFTDLQASGIDIRRDLFPYIQGKTSYLIRKYDPLNHILDFTLSMELNNSIAVKEFLLSIVRKNYNKKPATKYRTLFTQEFFGWEISGQELWMGVVEGNLLISSSEHSLMTLVQNIYEDKRGMLEKLPPIFKRSIENQLVGGQSFISSSQYIQNIKPIYHLLPFDFKASVYSIEWDFSFIQKKNNIGRQDIIRLKFF